MGKTKQPGTEVYSGLARKNKSGKCNFASISFFSFKIKQQDLIVQKRKKVKGD